MSLRLVGIRSAGDLTKERVVLRARLKVDIGRYAIFAAVLDTNNDQVLSGGLEAAYWFEDQEVGKDDYVVLYSKKGATSSKNNSDGSRSWFFYWDREETIWRPAVNAAVLAPIGTWTKLNAPKS
jgi:hypothetical protein